MTRSEIVIEVHNHIGFFKERWREFCQWIEGCGTEIETSWKKYKADPAKTCPIFQELKELNKKRKAFFETDDIFGRFLSYFSCLGLLKNSIERNKAEFDKHWAVWTHAFSRYLNTYPFVSDFPVPKGTVNPALWLTGYTHLNPRLPCKNELLLLDSVLLCVAHDVAVNKLKRIYRLGTYKGKYFQCDELYKDLQDKLYDKDKNEEIQLAWYDVKGSQEFKKWCDAQKITNPEAGTPKEETAIGTGGEQKPEETTQPTPIDLTKGTWNKSKNLDRLRKIDSNPKRDGIKGTKIILRHLKEYLEKDRHSRSDIAKTLDCKDGRIITSMSYGTMFLKK